MSWDQANHIQTQLIWPSASFSESYIHWYILKRKSQNSCYRVLLKSSKNNTVFYKGSMTILAWSYFGQKQATGNCAIKFIFILLTGNQNRPSIQGQVSWARTASKINLNMQLQSHISSWSDRFASDHKCESMREWMVAVGSDGFFGWWHRRSRREAKLGAKSSNPRNLKNANLLNQIT